MRKLLLLFILIALFIQIEGQTEKKITILHTNDMHSRFIGYAPESQYSPFTLNDDKTVGGFARIASILKSEKESNSGTTLVLDAGDFFMGTLFPSLESRSGFQLRLMKSMGYDVIGFGNHEYDFGPQWLAKVINTSANSGVIPSLLIGNAVFDNKDSRDDALEKLFSEKITARNLILSKDGLKIGVFSILGKDAAEVAPKSAPVTFEKQYAFARKMVKELKDQKCEIVICISHSGITKDKYGEFEGGDVELAKKVKGIDLIIGGHSHTKLDQPLIVNGIPIVQTGEFGQFVGRISLIYSNNKLRIENYKLIPVDDKIMGDKETSQLIEQQKARMSAEILDPLDIEYNKPVVETDFIIEGNDNGDYLNSNLGPLVADGIHDYINSRKGKGTDVSMIAAGMLFDKILPGIQSAPDIFRVVPLGSGKDDIPGYPLSRLYVTGKELKSILEILLVAGKSDPQNYCYYSGIKVNYNPDKGLLKKITRIDIIRSDGNMINVDFSKKNLMLYSVSADSYMLEFIGIIKKMSFGLINVVPKDFAGNKVTDMKNAFIDMDEDKEGIQEGKEWLALVRYVSKMKDTNGNGIPDLDKKYKGPVKSFFPSSPQH
jgi:5'-nucleotidase / UDP-sugar diphosphatase